LSDKGFRLGSSQGPFTNGIGCAAEDDIICSFGIRKQFICFGEEVDQASLIFKFEFERMVDEGEMVIKLIYDFNEVSSFQGCQRNFEDPLGSSGFLRSAAGTTPCMFIGIDF
jgi:hypothetical protein